MLLIKGIRNKVEVEKAVKSWNESAKTWVKSLEANGFVVSLTVLPGHIKTEESLADLYLKTFGDLHDPMTPKQKLAC